MTIAQHKRGAAGLWIIIILLAALLVGGSIYLLNGGGTPPEPGDTTDGATGGDAVPVQDIFSDKVVYTTSAGADQAALIQDCSERGGTFNECGSICPSDAEVCADVCAYTCELGDDTTADGTVPEEAANTMPVPETDTQDTGVTQEEVTIRYTDEGFSPRTITVPAGTAVTWVNESSRGMWVASAVHPTHEVLPEFDRRGIDSTGESYSFTFAEKGTWGFHNHVRAQDTGTVIIE